MKGPKALSLGLLAPAAIALALIAGLVAYSQVSAAAHAVSIGSTTADIGAQGSVDLDGLNMTAPGLGGWDIDITYDPAVVSVVSCTGISLSCNTAVAGSITAVGASGTGLIGDTTLATLTFQCDVAGSSALTLTAVDLVDATVGAPQPITATLTNGSVTCAVVQQATPTPTSTPAVLGATATPAPAVLPVTGGTPSDGGSSTIPGLLAIAGALAVMSAGGLWLAHQRRRVR